MPLRAPREHPQLHGREVLRLVDDHMTEAAGSALHERLGLVEEGEVAGCPRVTGGARVLSRNFTGDRGISPRLKFRATRARSA